MDLTLGAGRGGGKGGGATSSRNSEPSTGISINF